jgi:hypothetical protein
MNSTTSTPTFTICIETLRGSKVADFTGTAAAAKAFARANCDEAATVRTPSGAVIAEYERTMSGSVRKVA